MLYEIELIQMILDTNRGYYLIVAPRGRTNKYNLMNHLRNPYNN